jgi:diacylglycerol kinase family enzyme
LINPRSGDGSSVAEDVGVQAERRGLRVHVLSEGDDTAHIALKAADEGADALGIAGGDGSLAAVASAALDRDVPFVVVPLGTRNHFARDLGLDPDDPIAALAAFDGHERRVDVGLVGERLFLNNVSLGLYASFVHNPERQTRNRLVAFLRMAPAALGRSRRPLDVSFEVEGRRRRDAALLVLVANNGYEMTTMADLGERARLDEGLLHAYVIRAVARRSLLALLAHAAVGGLERAEGWIEWSAPAFAVESSRPRVHAAVDGEPAVLEAPLRFEIRPRALRVLVPTTI